MKNSVSQRLYLHVSVLTFLLLILTFLQGCDSLSGSQSDEGTDLNPQTLLQSNPNPEKQRLEITLNPASQLPPILVADTTFVLELYSDKTNDSSNYVLNTPRRIELEYGIIRRLLKRYGIDIQILNSNSITRNDMHNHVNLTRLLKRYGITPQVLSAHGDQLSDSLLAQYAITDAVLLLEDVTPEDLLSYNAFNSLLNTYQTSVEEYIRDQKETLPEVTVLGYLDNEGTELELAINIEVYDEVIVEMSDDPDIINILQLN
ncbi:MAG: hypothetical protein KTR29_23195 [Rhodothermaceae bacterium]|nr:hypothetical protein [Rhodothermaceae bacterium]